MLILYFLMFLPVSLTSTQVSVTLYYEPLCPFCTTFISKDLVPTFLDNEFGPLFKELNFIPFGLGKVVNATAHDYECYHDEAECQGNRFHSCAIKHIEDKKSLSKYISCLVELIELNSKEEEDYPVEQCQDKVPDVLYTKIMRCYNSDEGWKLLEEYGRRTTKFFSSGEEFVPYVSFGNVKNDYLAAEVITDFKKIMHRLTDIQYTTASYEESEEEEEDY